MFRVFLLFVLLGIWLATPFELAPLSDEQISYINNVQSSWKAGRNFKPEEFERAKRLLSVDTAASKRYNELHPIPVSSNAIIRDDLPKEFDSRKQWPNCKSINEVRDQSACASGWALSPAAAITDRMCIHTTNPVRISGKDILTCCHFCYGGCHGGQPADAWSYFEEEGIVTGGTYNSSQGCMPYPFPKCDHYVSGKYKPCQQHFPTPTCTAKCRKGYGKTYDADKHYGQGFSFFDSEEKIMQELVDNGPVTADFNAYEDFLSYKSGIYKYTTGKSVGRHVVKIIGYGVDKGQKYWTAVNTWNEDWGDKGFVYFSKGNNECGIESDVLSNMPLK